MERMIQMKIGIDIGGSHIGIGLVNSNGTIILKEEKFIKDKSNIEKKIEEYITENVIKMLQAYYINEIGIAVPGTVTGTKIVRAVNLGIENYDLVAILQNNLIKAGYTINIKMKNDGKCAALAEQKYGALAGYDNSVFLCIGTGVGSAVIFDGKLLEAKNVPGFEFSHTIIHRNGAACNCGKRGCFEVYASLKRFKEKIVKEFNLKSINGECVRDFIRKNSDNPTLRYMINSYIEDLSIGISNIINIFEPEAICLGGSFAEYEGILYEPLKNALINGNLLFNKRCDIIIKLAKLKNDAGIIGATLI
jgi:glucokinase